MDSDGKKEEIEETKIIIEPEEKDNQDQYVESKNIKLEESSNNQNVPWVKTREEFEGENYQWENKEEFKGENMGKKMKPRGYLRNKQLPSYEEIMEGCSNYKQKQPPDYEESIENVFKNKQPTTSGLDYFFNKNDNSMAPKLMVTYREQEECLDENKHRYVGLVNQASTCYLNSLIQTLYMTPEFRNAIYKWQFNGSNAQEHKNIQFQLQKLFLTLQTNQKSSLETKNLTTSFGWDSNEAYDQHDVQELCRVMFDALEHFWRKTSNSTTIQDLYEGTVEDYVKCLNCGTESMRKDIFLDLPLSVKEFGASFSYKSVEEALDAFVKPEILNENNQYDCSKCCSKQDAEKGLRITEFPYLLTIQLKRFDFDYETLHRIKLNDRITFPDFLDINGHLYRPKVPEPPKISYAAAAAKLKPEPKSTGSCETTPEDPFSSSTNEQSTSEGKFATTSDYDFFGEEKCWLNVEANSDQILHLLEQKGKYIYELFSIMVHQGSAAAGHYFAYIKNLDQNKWFCFNDSSVQVASKHDIYRTFGGWSYGYMNNTNAYMLMYRRVDPQRNESFVRSVNLPLHLKELQIKLINEEKERIRFFDESVKVVFRCNEVRCKDSNPICLTMNKDMTLDVVFENILRGLNEICESQNIRGGEEYPELEHKIAGCCRLVLSNRDWTMQEVLVQYDNIASPSNNDDGQIEGGYCVGSEEYFKRPLSALIPEFYDLNTLPEVFMIVDTKSPDVEQFCDKSSSLPSTPMISPVVSEGGSEDENKMCSGSQKEFKAITDITKTKEKVMRIKMFLDPEAP